MVKGVNLEDRHGVSDKTGAPCLARPNNVLNDPPLTTEQKRSILAFWLSDQHTVPDAPRWRLLENGAFADSEDIMRALYALDIEEMNQVGNSGG
ncbi:hypothetical protein [Acidiphilium sp.]|uniref:hypothetical protein n=1 Tax=Acidiphilium sp. TaxID=527 RepID=UPI0025850DC7|nr:hypothetical protein [Acidiphilium sp.]